MSVVFDVPRIQSGPYSLLSRVSHIRECSRLELQLWLCRFKQERSLLLFRCSCHQMRKITGKMALQWQWLGGRQLCWLVVLLDV